METLDSPVKAASRPAWTAPRQPVRRGLGKRWPPVAVTLGLSAAALGVGQLTRASTNPLARLLRGGGVFLTVASWAYLLWLRRWHLRWGATDEELMRPMAADERVPHPALETTRALTIDAPPEAVWPWLAQMGHRRGGWYAYDWLDNFGVPSARRVIPELQDLRVGDRIAPTQRGFVVASLEPPRSLVLESRDERGRVLLSWSFLLVPLEPGRTRFIERIRGIYDANLKGLLMYLAVEPADFVMMRRQMLNLKRRAERRRDAAPLPGQGASWRRR